MENDGLHLPHEPIETPAEVAAPSGEALPEWLWALLAAVEDYETWHPIDARACFHDVVTAIPGDVRTAARVRASGGELDELTDRAAAAIADLMMADATARGRGPEAGDRS